MAGWDDIGLYGRSTKPRLLLSIRVTSCEQRAVEAARTWFDLSFERLGGGLRARLVNQPERRASGPEALRLIPGTVRGILQVAGKELFDTPDRFLNLESWSDFLEELAGLPLLAAVQLDDVDGQDDQADGIFQITCRRITVGDETWLDLLTMGDQSLIDSPAGQETMTSVLRDVCQFGDVVYGEISWLEDTNQTVLERALGLRPAEILAGASMTSRGYAWLTVIPAQAAARLGGRQSLAKSRAFAKVQQLPNGALWLQSKPDRFVDYDESAASQIFQELASVLPPGQPNLYMLKPPNILIDRDASATAEA
ncbi:hypothetical protein HDA40_005529 [Hamadaea flava]|uniref:Uncharacterized protein n=1 Tax=Hamadaea flava TaxID=1742688 RepID=A0ABV8LZ44_9ACTN|nr:hypothetical protein [Hamadaea flava]MCP2327022.1 hypothetical protein [Hamadaea flava]